MKTHRLLVEIGTEELPPTELKFFARALQENLRQSLADADFHIVDKTQFKTFCTPRRLAAEVKGFMEGEIQYHEREGPKMEQCFDEKQKPTKAAVGFCASHGVKLNAPPRKFPDDENKIKKLREELKTNRPRLFQRDGRLLVVCNRAPGPAPARAHAAIAQALEKMPIARRMRWGDGDINFARPVHWALALLDDRPVQGELLGLKIGDATRGHRFMCDKPSIAVKKISDYAALLKKNYVIADFSARQRAIVNQINSACKRLGAEALVDAALLDEVTSMVEWPRAIVGEFEEKYLRLPEPVLIEVMRAHQRYFPLKRDGRLLNRFIVIANIQSRRPALIREGNERVIRPRLADAEFFHNADSEKKLQQWIPQLKHVAFHRRLGMMSDLIERATQLSEQLGEALELKENEKKALLRGAELCKADLLTEMVQEMPSLQGVIGERYALRDGEEKMAALAIREHYLPRFSGDAKPKSAAGRALALALRIDALCGIFNTEKNTGGSHDPFGMRRQALGLIHILLDADQALNLRPLLNAACANYQAQGFALAHGDAARRTLDFILERLRGVWEEQRVPHNIGEAILASRPECVVDADRRRRALQAFMDEDEAPAFAETFKRARNILRGNADAAHARGEVDTSLLVEPAEQTLAAAVYRSGREARALLDKGDYSRALRRMAQLAAPVDDFFSAVMVICEDTALRGNRLRMLGQIDAMFSDFADISRL